MHFCNNEDTVVSFLTLRVVGFHQKDGLAFRGGMAESEGRMTLQGVQVFLAVVAAGSISAAAKSLGASPSSVSQHVTNLEAALGTRLIDRAARPVAVTPAGAMFLRRAEIIQSEARQARAELSRFDLSQLTLFRLGMIEDFDADVTPRLLADMASQLQGCHFVLETGASYHLAAMLESRTLDVIVAADLDLSADWMESYPLLADPFLVVAPRGRVKPGGDVLGQLLEMPFIRYSNRQMMGRQIEAHLSKLDLSIPHRFELDSYHAIMAMVAGGAGWSVTTPLGYTRAQRFKNQVDVMALPFAPLARRISLFARKDAMETMPRDMADSLRPLINALIIRPAVKELPWLSPSMVLL